MKALRTNEFTHLLFYRAGLTFLRGPTPRPPTLSSLVGQSPFEQSTYPITDEDLDFLTTLLDLCQIEDSIFGIYDIYRIP